MTDLISHRLLEQLVEFAEMAEHDMPTEVPRRQVHLRQSPAVQVHGAERLPSFGGDVLHRTPEPSRAMVGARGAGAGLDPGRDGDPGYGWGDRLRPGSSLRRRPKDSVLARELLCDEARETFSDRRVFQALNDLV